MPTFEITGGTEVIATVREALQEKLGADRFDLWFALGLRLAFDGEGLRVEADTQFLLQRVQKRLLGPLREVVSQIWGDAMPVRAVVVDSVENADSDCAAHHRVERNVEAMLDSTSEQLIASVLSLSGSASSAAETSDEGPFKKVPSSADHAPRSKATAKPSQARGASSKRERKPANNGPRKLVPAVVSANEQDDVAPNAKSDSSHSDGPQRSLLAGTSLANFCVGQCNQLAHVAAKMVIEQPGSPSPLFFWGPAGTGKTHLLAAIRNELRQRHQLRRVVLLSAEQFTNDFTGAVRGSGLPGFRRRYRDVEALLIDDVQFVGGKRATLRELLYTVDSLLRTRCQLAFTADRPPLELEGLNDELTGRMAGGMVCPMRPLDRETRRAVLEGLAAQTATKMDPEVLDRLADELAGDGRILSGAVNHLRMLGTMLERPATWDELLHSAPELLAAGRPAVDLGDIQKAVCDMFGLPSGALRSRGQQRSVSQPRMLAMYLARQYTRAAFSEIGDYFGNRSHSTVIAATKRVENWIHESTPLRRGSQVVQPRQLIEAIESMLRTG